MIRGVFEVISSWLIPFMILITLCYGIFKKVPVYETFVDGSKDGLKIAVTIVP